MECLRQKGKFDCTPIEACLFHLLRSQRAGNRYAKLAEKPGTVTQNWQKSREPLRKKAGPEQICVTVPVISPASYARLAEKPGTVTQEGRAGADMRNRASHIPSELRKIGGKAVNRYARKQEQSRYA